MSSSSISTFEAFVILRHDILKGILISVIIILLVFLIRDIIRSDGGDMPSNNKAYVDFDGTLAHYEGLQGEEILGEPIEGATEVISTLREEGWEVYIYTARTNTNTNTIKTWCEVYGVAVDGIYTGEGKPKDATVFIDDRAVEFKGNWYDVLDKLHLFNPWWAKLTTEELNEE